MNQQELEVIVNHIVMKQDELLVAIKTVRTEPDFSVLLSEIERNRRLLEENIELTKSRNEEALKRYGEKLQTQLNNQKAINMLFVRNSQLLEYFKNHDQQRSKLKINQLPGWIKKNMAWIAFFCLSVTFCFALYYMAARNAEPPTYKNLTAQKLKKLDSYMDQHPKLLDSLLNPRSDNAGAIKSSK